MKTNVLRLLAGVALVVVSTAMMYGQATKLAIIQVNGGSDPVAGTPFSVIVQAQDGASAPTAVVATTVVTLSLGTGTGTLAGTLTDSILLGQNSVTISGVTYTKAQAGVVLTASATSGDSLSAGNSAAFTVDPGSAKKLVITGSGTQTAGATQDLIITARDSLGNTATGYAGLQPLIFSGASSSTNPVTAPTVIDHTGAAVNFGVATSINFVLGVATVVGADNGVMTLYRAETATISVTDGFIGTSGADRLSVTVSPATNAGKFVWNLASPQSNGIPFTGTNSLTAEDNWGNTVTSFTAATDSVTVTSSPTGVVSGLGAGNTNVLNQAGDFASGVSNLTTEGMTYTGSAGSRTFTATAGGGRTGTSGSVTISAGAPASIAATGGTPQSAQVGSAFATLQATVLDASSNPVAGATVTFTAPGSGASGTFAGGVNTAVTSASGVASSAIYTANTIAGPDTVKATVVGVGTAAKFLLTNNPGPLNNFLVEAASGGAIPTQIAGAPFNISITARDVNNNTVSSFVGTVTITSTGALSGGGGSTPAFTAGILASRAVAISNTGNFKIIATKDPSGPESGSSNTFDVGPGSATSLKFGVQPSNDTAGTVMTPAVTVQILDANNNVVTTDNTTMVSLAIGANPGLATLSGGGPVMAIGGIATFSGISLDKAGTAYTLVASSSPVLAQATSSAFNISASGATKLAFGAQPSNTAAGSSITPAVTVRIEDAAGNLVGSATNTVTLGIGTDPGLDTLSGTKSVAAIGGIATFSSLSINKTGTGYTLIASSPSTPGLTHDTSAAFNITPGAANKLAILQEPSNAAAGASITPAVTVRIEDAHGNVVTNDNATTVSFGIGVNPGGATLSGGGAVAASSGIATFSAMSLNKVGTGYTLIASSPSSPGLTHDTSAAFNITPATASAVAFLQEPTSATAGGVIAPPVTVQLKDHFGNNVLTTGTQITLALLTGTGTLSGTLNQNTSSGVATFANLSVNLTGDKTIRATSGALTPDTSATFTISPLAAKKVAFVAPLPPVTTPAGTAFSANVQLQDSLGNNVSTSGTTVTLSLIGSGPLRGTLSTTTNAGLATFNNLSIDTAGAGKRIVATSAGLVPDTSSALAVTASTASKLAFTTQPVGGTAGVAFTTQPVVSLQDQFGNTVTNTAQNVTLALQANPGADSLRGTRILAVNTATGQAVFAGLSLVKAASGYTLTATGSTVSTTAGVVVSSPFTIVHAAPTKIIVETAANGTGVRLPKQNVSSGTSITVYSISRDPFDNFVADTTAAWSMINLIPPSGGVVQGDLAASGDTRSAIFTAHVIGKGQINAASGTLTPTPSDTLTVVVAGTPSKIFVETAANGTGIALPDTVIASQRSITVYSIARDASNNFVSNTAATWSIQSPTGGVVGGDLVPAGSALSATFTGHVIGTSRVLAQSGSLTPTTSGVITVKAGNPGSIAATGGTPQSASIDSAFSANLQATVKDSSNNVVPNVLVNFGAPAAGASGTFAGGVTTALTDAGGVATAPVFRANKIAGSYVDTARVAGVAAPALFQLTNSAGGASSITPVAGTTPQHASVNSLFATNLAVVVRDSSGNPVSGVSVLFDAPSSGASGTFTDSHQAFTSATSQANGIATAASFLSNGISGPDSVLASTSGVATSAVFALYNDPLASGSIVVTGGSPQSGVVNTVYAVPIQVSVTDNSPTHNPIPNLLVTFTAPASGATGTFSKNGTRVDSAFTNSSGVATASSFTANTVSGSFTVTAAAPAGPGFGTAAISLTNLPAIATHFTLSTPGTHAAIGTQLATVPFNVVIISRDVYENPALLATLPVNLAFSSNGPLASPSGPVEFGQGGSDSLVQSVTFSTSGTNDTLKVAHGGGTEKGASNPFAVVNPVPGLVSVTPANGRKGVQLDVVLTGTGFIPGVTSVSFNTANISVATLTVISPTQMTATIQIQNAAPDTVLPVTVNNGTPGGGTFILQRAFTIGKTPAPTIDSVAPATGNRLQTLNVVLRGTNYLSGVTTVNMGPGIAVNSTTVDSASQITASITISAAAATGPRSVIVISTVPPGAGGGADTLRNGFTVNNPAPALTSVSQPSVVRLQTLNIVLVGDNFVPGASSLSFGDTAIVVNSLSVDSVWRITANVTIGGSSRTGEHSVSVTNAAPGGGTATLSNVIDVANPVPTLTGINPAAGNRLQTLNVVMKGSNFIGNVSSVSFGNDIAVISVRVDSVSQITAQIAIGAAAALGQRYAAVINPPPGGDTSGGQVFTVAVALPGVPVLLLPADNATNQPSIITLQWRSSAGATAYGVQVSSSSAFASTVIDSAVTDTTLQIGPLAFNTTFYWRVNAKNDGGTSAYAAARSFVSSYPATIVLRDTLVYPVHAQPSDYQQSEYRIVGMPGNGGAPLARYMRGSAGTDWQAYWDNGAATNYYQSYAPGAPFVFSPGRAFFIIGKGNIPVADTVPSVPLDGSGMATIPLHSSWNLIANPFPISLLWDDVLSQNPPARDTLFGFSGNFTRSSTLDPYTGYYFENRANLTSLKIPYRTLSPSPKILGVPAATDSWRVSIDLQAAGAVEHVSTFGVSPGASEGLDSLDGRRPRVFKTIPSTSFPHPEWDAAQSDFASDIRPPVKDVEVWDLDVRTILRDSMKLQFSSLDLVPGALQVYLIDETRARYVDLRANAGYAFTPVLDVSKFRVVVGTPDAVSRQLDAVAPKEFALGNNYPNPFNPSTTIPVAVPQASDVQLVVYNILGERVKTLYNGHLESGRYWFAWDGRGDRGSTMATGVYIVRMATNRGASFTRKMMLLK